MAVEERDPLTGHLTTGHEWNGIKELNTPVPKPVYFFLSLAFLVSVGYWIFLPAWPLGRTYTKGLLAYDQHQDLRDKIEKAAERQVAWKSAVEQKTFEEILADPALMTQVREVGHALFGDNCAVCHGVHATGNPGFPNLAAGTLNWGEAPEAFQETIRIGINSQHPESRTAQMPAFGRDGILDRAQIETVSAFVRQIGVSGLEQATATHADGAQVFQDNCAACHGEKAEGNPDLGVPNLGDGYWLYGGDAQSVYTSIAQGRQGHMPTWEARIKPVDVKVLAAYLADLRGEKP